MATEGQVNINSNTGSVATNTTLGDLFDVGISSVANLNFLRYNSTTGKWENVAQSAIDHGSIGGLTDDDHTQYVLDAGDTMTGHLIFNDNIKALFGTGSDASIYYDGTDLFINSQEVGTGLSIFGEKPASGPGYLSVKQPDMASGSVQNGATGGVGYYLTAQTGQDTDGSGTGFVIGGTGGSGFLYSGGGGDVSGTQGVLSAGGASGAITIRCGDGGNNTASTAIVYALGGSGGNLSIRAGDGGQCTGGSNASNTGGGGGSLSFLSGSGRSSSGSSVNNGGAGGNLTFTAGKAGAAGSGGVAGEAGDMLFYVYSGASTVLGYSIDGGEQKVLFSNIPTRHSDNVKALYGTAGDASIYYDGTDVIINAREVGTGNIKVSGAIEPQLTDNLLAYSDTRVITSDTQAGTIFKTFPTLEGSYTDSSYTSLFGGDMGFTDERTLQSNGFFGCAEAGSYGIRSSVNRNSNFSGQINNYKLYGFFNNFVDNGVYTIPGTALNKNSTMDYYGGGSIVNLAPTLDTEAGNTIDYNGYGQYISVTSGPTLTTGTLTSNIYGSDILVVGTTTGTSTAYGQRIDVSGCDTNYGFYNNSAAAHNLLGLDNVKTFFGTALDASIYYDGTDMYFNSREVGTGDFVFSGGNVGIGTTSPATKLEVNGAVTLTETSAPATPAATKCVLYCVDDGDGTTSAYIKFDDGSTTRIAGN